MPIKEREKRREVWVTKWWGTTGIVHVLDAKIIENDRAVGKVYASKGHRLFEAIGKHAFFSEAEARHRVHDLRERKKVSLRKQLEALEKGDEVKVVEWGEQ